MPNGTGSGFPASDFWLYAPETSYPAGGLSVPAPVSTARETAALRHVGRMRQIRWPVSDLPRTLALRVSFPADARDAPLQRVPEPTDLQR